MRLLILLTLFLLSIVPVKASGIAVIAPKDGDEAIFTRQLVEGVKIAVDEINDAGGLLGEKVELITIDDACSETFAQGETQHLFLGEGSGINLVIGPYCEGKSLAYKNRKALQILPQPLGKDDFNEKVLGVLKIGGEIKLQAEVLFAIYKDKWIDKNIAVIYDSRSKRTYDTAEYLQKLFIDGNLSNRIKLYDLASYKKMKSLAKEVAASGKIAYILGNKSQIARLAQQLQEKNEDITIVIDEYQAGGHFFKEMGNFAEGTYWLRLDDQKANAEFTDKLIDMRIKGYEPHGLGVMGYASVMVWRDMTKKANSYDVKLLDNTAAKGSWTLPWGKVKFNEGKISRSCGWNMYRFEDGEYTQVN